MTRNCCIANCRGIVVSTTTAVILVTIFLQGGMTQSTLEALKLAINVDPSPYLNQVHYNHKMQFLQLVYFSSYSREYMYIFCWISLYIVLSVETASRRKLIKFECPRAGHRKKVHLSVGGKKGEPGYIAKKTQRVFRILGHQLCSRRHANKQRNWPGHGRRGFVRRRNRSRQSEYSQSIKSAWDTSRCCYNSYSYPFELISVVGFSIIHGSYDAMVKQEARDRHRFYHRDNVLQLEHPTRAMLSFTIPLVPVFQRCWVPQWAQETIWTIWTI